MTDVGNQNTHLEIDLFALCGNDRSLAGLVGQALPMIDGLAAKHAGQGLSALALSSHGCVGLVEAVEIHDAATDGKFLVHALPMVENAMLNARVHRLQGALSTTAESGPNRALDRLVGRSYINQPRTSGKAHVG
jgi:hypothetical protein